jgi:hypothetical protein
VELTRDLFELGARQGHLVYRNRDGHRLRVPVDWSEAAVLRRLERDRPGGAR